VFNKINSFLQTFALAWQRLWHSPQWRQYWRRYAMYWLRLHHSQLQSIAGLLLSIISLVYLAWLFLAILKRG
jgi:hypothetical protein